MDKSIDQKIDSNFSRITVSLASPESIMAHSHGEVLKPETINYRSYKPERDGLFCEKIFGPVKDWECHCGKYKRIRYKGTICDHCGVEVTEKKVRRERAGHIKLVVPIAHIWYFRSLPNKIGALLGIPAKKLEEVIYYESYIVVQPGKFGETHDGEKGSKKLDLISEQEYHDILKRAGNETLSDKDKFIAKEGAEAIYDLLAELSEVDENGEYELDKRADMLREEANVENSVQRKQDLLKRLQVFEAFRDSRKRMENKPEWMVMRAIPVIPPELRPLVPLDGGRFATSDLNELYRRVIIRNNRLKRLIEISAPAVILRNEKRMLQEAVDSLFDNSRKSSAVKAESNRPLKSLSDSLKGKQGRFRQNLLGKRVDYSGRSVIVVGPDLNMNECGLPKDMAAELFKPFVIRKLIERGIVKTVKSAKKIVDRKDPAVWDILENILKGHPVLLNRAPTLHRLGIQAFQPKLVEGKAIRLHPLVCTAFNADFDGDQMAVHVPLGNAAVLEAQILMLASHNILNPANGAPITVPSQDMVLGLYYITKPRKSTPEHPVKGEGKTFYGPEEVIIAYNEKKIDMHAVINVVVTVRENDELVEKKVETTVGRVLFNQVVPKEFGFVNKLLDKKTLRDIIGEMVKLLGTSTTTHFLDDVKNMGYSMAFKGGLSFNLGNVLVPSVKEKLIEEANAEVAEIRENYDMGLITDKERYNKIVDIWGHVKTNLSSEVMSVLTKDDQGFNPVFMMLDSGARGSKDQISQLCGMRGLMAKPQKTTAAGGADIIENPILANFKEGLSVLEYFISTHGARKGLADTALKTADAGYLTRRLVDVAHDVIITEKDCGTLRGLTMTALKRGEEVLESLYDRILGRVALHDVVDPKTDKLIVAGGDEINETKAKAIVDAGIESVEIRSVLTCESKHGVCANCYGRNLSSGKLVQRGEAVGVIAAQSIGEPGTQLTLRTFHQGGTASKTGEASSIISKHNGLLEITDLRSVDYVDDLKNKYQIVTGRSAEMKILDMKTKVALTTRNIPYGSKLYFKSGDQVKAGDLICEWDPYNAVILSEYAGTVRFNNIVEGSTYHDELDEQTNKHEWVIIEGKKFGSSPSFSIIDKSGQVIKTYDLPVGAHISSHSSDGNVKDGFKVKAGDILVKMPRVTGSLGDITGGLPRVTELFEARNSSEPAVVSEIDGEVSFGDKLVRKNKKIIITSKKTGERREYLVPTSKQILAQEGDFVKAGQQLSDGAITPANILAIEGPTKVQEYIVNEIQEVYRSQGVTINGKHFEVIVRQMMRKVEIKDHGDTRFLEGDIVNKIAFQEENDNIFGKVYVEDAGDSESLRKGQIVSARRLHDENSMLKRKDKRLVVTRPAKPAQAAQVLQGITRAALQTDSFISAASFQETTKVLTLAAINAKSDTLEGMKENVIVGHKIPAGTGLREYDDLIVSSKEDYDEIVGANIEMVAVDAEEA